LESSRKDGDKKERSSAMCSDFDQPAVEAIDGKNWWENITMKPFVLPGEACSFEQPQLEKVARSAAPDPRIVSGMHYPEVVKRSPVDARQSCKVCHQKTRYKCAGCNAFLCIRGVGIDSCYKHYHKLGFEAMTTLFEQAV
jgi:hypothetical protein